MTSSKRPVGVFALAVALIGLGACAVSLSLWIVVGTLAGSGPRTEVGGWVDPEGWAMVGVYIFSFLGACGLAAVGFGLGLWRGWRWTRWVVVASAIGGALWCAGFAAIVGLVNPADFGAIAVGPLLVAPALGGVAWYFLRPSVVRWFSP